MEYSILIHKAGEGGFWPEVPALPGCFSQDETIEETIANTMEAIELIIFSVLKEENREIPVEEEFTVPDSASNGSVMIPTKSVVRSSTCRIGNEPHG